MKFNNLSILFSLFFSIMLWSACGDGDTTESTKDVMKQVVEKPATEVKAAMSGRDVEKKSDEAVNEKSVDAEVKEVAKEEPKKEEVKKEKKPKKKKRAKMHFPEKVYDYGFIMQGDTVRHDFYFKNVGSDDLLITRVEPSCGCTVPIYPKKPIPPGEDGKVSVIFKSAGKLGRQVPSIQVYTNYKRKIKLELKGYVDAERAKVPTTPKVVEEPEESKQ